MNDKIQNLVQQIQALEAELAAALHEQEVKVRYHITGKRVYFEQVIKQAHKRLKVGLFHWFRTSHPLNILSAPIIYSLILPMLILDASLLIYQACCFRLYKIPRVARSNYFVIDRHQLAYLNIIEKINCLYCSYVNGLIAYARELASLTEQYWCPIKHARKVIDPHSRYRFFIDYGDAEDYHEHQLQKQRADARQLNVSDEVEHD